MTSLFVALIITYYADGTSDTFKPKFYYKKDCERYISTIAQRKEELVLDGNNIWTYKKVNKITSICVKDNK